MSRYTILRTKGNNLFLVKFWFPLILLAGVFGVSGWNLSIRRLVFDLPLLIAALFGMSIASVEVCGDVIRYRRFFKWTTVRHEEVSGAGAVWAPFFGYLRLNRFVFPWGRIYFALDANLNPNPLKRGEYPLLRYLNKESFECAPAPAVSHSASDRSLKLKMLNAAFVGVLFSIALHILNLTPPRQSVMEPPFPGNLPANQPILIAAFLRILQLINTLPGLLIWFALLVILTASRYRKPDAWIAAFLTGTALVGILLHLL